MRHHICSRDNYFRKGLNTIIANVPANAISCGGEMIFVDLLYPGDFKDINYKNACHIFFIGNHEAVFDFLHDIEFSYDTYFIQRNVDIHKLQSRIELLITSIMRRYCFWSGIRFPLPQRSHNQHLTSRETKVLQRLKQHRSLIVKKDNVALRIKTTHDLKASEVSRGGNFIQHSLERQAIVIENLHTYLKDKKYSSDLSSTEICRQVCESPPQKNSLSFK